MNNWKSTIIPEPLSCSVIKEETIEIREINLQLDRLFSPLETILSGELLRIDCLKLSETGFKIEFKTDPHMISEGDESYRLESNQNGITIVSASYPGAYYGSRSLLQLLRAGSSRKECRIPEVKIFDKPRFPWRGIMLDISRHFFPKEEIMRLIDIIAYYKLNRLHLHLTDDQGWRIEIKKYPELTRKGSERDGTLIGKYTSEHKQYEYDDIPVTGFLSSDDVRELVRYGESRAVQIMPEIDMPGHMQAAFAAYPELGDGTPAEVFKRWGVNRRILNTSEKTMTFLKDVLDEVTDLFPFPFVHIGGDECPVDQWKSSPDEKERMEKRGIKSVKGIQSWLMKEAEDFLRTKNRRAVVWDEVVERGTEGNPLIMCWRGNGKKAARKAVKAGLEFLMTPGSTTYFDYGQSRDKDEPLSIGGSTSVKNIYKWNPFPSVAGTRNKSDLLQGGQGQLWTEYIKNTDYLDYMAFPRSLALSEVLWSEPANKNWNDFCRRLEIQKAYLAYRDIKFRIGGTKKSLGAFQVSEGGELKIPFDPDFGSSGSLQFYISKSGMGTLQVQGVMLRSLGTGEVLLEDNHSAMTGPFNSDNVYTLHYSGIQAKQNFQIEIRFENSENNNVKIRYCHQKYTS